MKLRSTDIDGVYKVLKKEFTKHRLPVSDLIEAQTRDPFKVLLATILSSRTRDETTAKVSRRLFTKVTSYDDLEQLSISEIEELIYPVGFYHAKAKMLKKLPSVLREEFNGMLPDTVDDLVKLPGVGRKVANLVVAVGFSKPAICVDVHVHRICNRLGYVRTKSPFETEMKLREYLPVNYWTTINSYLVSFGQHTCLPVNPHCDRCPVYDCCSRVKVKTKYPKVKDKQHG